MLNSYYYEPTKNTPKRYSEFGIESSEFIFNNLSLLITLSCFSIIYLSTRLLKKLIKNRNGKIAACLVKIIRKCEWSLYLRYFIQNYLAFAITSSLDVLYVRYIQPLKNAIYDYIFATLCIIIIMISPWIIYYYMRKYHDRLGQEEIISRWGSLYDDVSYSKSKGVSMNIVVFLLRRHAYSLAIVYLDFNPLIQVGFCYISSGLVISI